MELVGRDRERALLRALCDAAHAGDGGANCLVGPVGVGLTSLLVDLADVARSRPMDVASVTARRDEAALPRTLLRDLAGQLPSLGLDAIVVSCADDELPAAWAGAVLASAQPVLLVVDDLQAADPVSALTLRYLARRLGGSQVALVAASHSTAAVLDESSTTMVGGLDQASLAAVLGDRVSNDPVSSDVCARVHQISGGNPLAALELVRGMSTGQRSGSEALPPLFQLGAGVAAALGAAFDGLPIECHRALFLVACEPSGHLQPLSHAAHTLGVDLAALDPAEAAGIVTVTDGSVEFQQPIMRLAAYQLVAAPSRRAAHRALAAALDAPADAERRALHLALGVALPDERIAADLEAAARSAERRGDHVAARQWLLHAARLSPNQVQADERRRAAFASAQHDGPLARLTATERRVAQVVAGGLSNKEAAATLHVSVKTVDTHLQSIYRKLDLRSRSELTMVITRLQAGNPEEVR